MKLQSSSRLIFGLGLMCLLSACSASNAASDNAALAQAPHAEREFRAAWVATVANIDWPSKPGLSTSEQQKEALAILDTASHLHLNAIILQVRPQCDALYRSMLEPWSYYLTGAQGKAPEPFYDPLSFWVEEAHNRGIELHVWFNPYRAHLPAEGELTDASFAKQHPELAKRLPDGMYWLDPGKKATQDHSYAVVMDVVSRYDIDGVHFDDYFYPYGDGNFPDDESWGEYQRSGGTLSRDDWRRENVNTFVERIYRGIKHAKPSVKFGISPFGIWRPGYPASVSGFDQYSGLYADAKLWLNKGWVDYWTPQLYWPINQVPQSFPVLLGWWAKENTEKRNLWPGMIITRAASERGTDEAINEIMVTRGMVPDAPGHAHFSMKVFMRDTTVFNQALLAGPYRNQALVPGSPWLDQTPPQAPAVELSPVGADSIRITWTPADAADAFHYVLYYQYGTAWTYTIFNRADRSVVLARSRSVANPRARRASAAAPASQEIPPTLTESLTQIALTAVDRLGNESVQVPQALAK
ncbi:MAG: glycoside hydrolase family 10 protein [Acidobacteriota bacterium]